MEENKKERDLMSLEEFKEHVAEKTKTLNLRSYEIIQKFKSAGRAIKRGHATSEGIVLPERPFHNRRNTCKEQDKSSRGINEFKKQIYERIKQYQRRES